MRLVESALLFQEHYDMLRDRHGRGACDAVWEWSTTLPFVNHITFINECKNIMRNGFCMYKYKAAAQPAEQNEEVVK